MLDSALNLPYRIYNSMIASVNSWLTAIPLKMLLHRVADKIMVLKTLTPVCTFVSVYSYTRVRTYTHTCIYIHVCIPLCIISHVSTHRDSCTCILYTSVCACSHTYVDTLLLIFYLCYHYSEMEAIRNGHIASITTTS